MPRIADGQAAAGRKKRADHGGGERRRLRHGDELLVEQAHEFGLVEAVDEAPHQGPQIGGGGGDRGTVPGNVGQQQAGDASGSATRGVVNVSAALRFAKGLAVHPNAQPAHFNVARGQLASTPDFHALHVLCGRLGHDCIIAGHGLAIGSGMDHLLRRSLASLSISRCDSLLPMNQAVL